MNYIFLPAEKKNERIHKYADLLFKERILDCIFPGI